MRRSGSARLRSGAQSQPTIVSNHPFIRAPSLFASPSIAPGRPKHDALASLRLLTQSGRRSAASNERRRSVERGTAMKLVRYGRPGKEKPGLIDSDGKLRDLSKKLREIDGAALAPASLKALRGIKVERLPVVRGKQRLGAPIARIGKVIA